MRNWILLFVICLLPFFSQAQATHAAGVAPKKAAPKPVDKKISVFTTAAGTDYRITLTDTLQFADFGQPLETEPCVFVDPTKSFQTFIGIGGALTDASAETYARLPKEKQDELMQKYFDPVLGIGYTLARTNIHSCDFSSYSYTYVFDNDTALKTFSVAHDEQYRIPFIKQAIAAAGGKLLLYASPWSPPAWMKTNNSMLHGGKLKPEFYQSWANYTLNLSTLIKSKAFPSGACLCKTSLWPNKPGSPATIARKKSAILLRTIWGLPSCARGSRGKNLLPGIITAT